MALSPVSLFSPNREGNSLKSYSLTQFYNTAKRIGFAKNFLFRVKEILGVPMGDMGDMLIYAISSKIPDKKINIATVNYQSYNFRVPMNAEYPERENWRLKFYCDEQYDIRKRFEDWSDYYYNIKRLTGGYKTIHNIELVLLEAKEDSLKEIRSYQLVGCVPTLISNSEMNTTRTGEPVTVDVTLAFQYLNIKDIKQDEKAEDNSFFGTLKKISTISQNTIRDVNKVTNSINNVTTGIRNLKNIRTLRR